MLKIKILDVKIDNLTASKALKKVERFMTDGKQHYIVTANPEFLVKAQNDDEFKKILNQADLAVADGVGLVFASWFLGQPLKQRITGVDLIESICNLASRKNWPVFLLGGREGVAESVVNNLKKKYYLLNIKAFEAREVLFSQGILFVAFGAPKQEKWIVENLGKMPLIKLAMGVGGAFDFRAVAVFPWLVIKLRIYQNESHIKEYNKQIYFQRHRISSGHGSERSEES